MSNAADSAFRSALTNFPAPPSSELIRFEVKSKRSDITAAFVPNELAVDLSVVRALSKSFMAVSIFASVAKFPAATAKDSPDESDAIPVTVSVELPSSLNATFRLLFAPLIRFVPLKLASFARLSSCPLKSLNCIAALDLFTVSASHLAASARPFICETIDWMVSMP